MASYPPAIASDRPPLRLRLLPPASTMAGSLLGLLPLVVETPWWPSCGLLIALGWRLLRPELWAAWVALPLGLFDDLVGGAPLGSAAALWTIAFLAIEVADGRLVYRTFIDEWQLGAAALAGISLGQWGVALLSGARAPFWAILPQIGVAVLALPMALAICARLDRWRLSAGPVIAP